MSDSTVLEFQIQDAREAIGQCFVALAKEDIPASERKVVREKLEFNIIALRDLKQRQQLHRHGKI
jgi:hypothetical protein